MWMLMFFNDRNGSCKSVSGNKALAPGIALIAVQVNCQEFRKTLCIWGRGVYII